MAPRLDFRTDNNHDQGICTGMSTSWAKHCLRLGRAPKSQAELGYALSVVAQLGQRKYVAQGFGQLLAGGSVGVQAETSRKSTLFSIKSRRFTNAANDVVQTPGIYLICTSDHTMGAARFARSSDVVFLDPNFGQYTFVGGGEFPGWYYNHVRTAGYNLAESLLIKLGNA